VKPRRVLVFVLWAAGLALLLPRAAGLERRLDVSTHVPGSESELVDSLLTARFGSPYTRYAVLVLTGVPHPGEAGGRELLDTIAARVAAVPGVTRVRTARTAADTLFVVPAPRMVLLVAGLDAAHEPADRIVSRLQAATRTLEPALRRRHPHAALRWTGQDVLNGDLREASSRDAHTAERRVLPVSLALLVLGFGGLVAALVPVAGGVVVIGCALGAAGWIAELVPLSLLLQTFVSMLGLGLGIDYALLVVARFREARRAGRPVAEAARETARASGHTVAVSAATVGIGFLALLLVPVTELRSVALGGMLAAALAALFATTLLPALLARFGERLDAVSLPLPWSRHAHGAWLRWGGWVTRHPRLVLVVAGLPLLALAAPARRLRVGLPHGTDWLPQRLESVVALHALESSGRDGVLQAVRVLVELPPGSGALTPRGWGALERVNDALAADGRVGAVWSFARFDTDRPMSRLTLFGLPRDVRDSYLARDMGSVLLEAIPRPGTDPTALVGLVRALRARGSLRLTGLSDARVRIGGLPAMRADYDAAVGARFGLVVALVLGGTLVALFVGFRSLLIPLKAMALNLLSVGAGFGAIVLVFQEGQGIGHVFAFVPVLVFCTVFGLSMDYEVFLLSRVAEERAAGRGDQAAVAYGLAGVAPVITSAAAVMVAVFAAFALGQLLVIRMLGLALAVAVLVDATVVRVALGPALVVLAGRWNWWPGDR
jgi:RND superfamily putative drug exporter